MMPWLIGGGAVGVIVVVVLLIARGKRKPVAGAAVYRELMGAGTGSSASAESPRLQELRQNLRVKLLYQEDKVDAAIQFERERNPSASLEQLMVAAIERWERDNR
jgi:hypothetical protein